MRYERVGFREAKALLLLLRKRLTMEPRLALGLGASDLTFLSAQRTQQCAHWIEKLSS